MMQRRQFLALAATASLALVASSMMFQPRAIAETIFHGDIQGVAINGYDPVAYFTESKAVKGSADLAFDHGGSKFYFASAENRDAFKANPAKYAPQYGGYCAFAASKGKKAPTDPQAFTIVDDKLYLNFSKQVRTLWSQDIKGNIGKADKLWPEISG